MSFSISYIYVLDSHGYLKGIVSIHELLLAADEEILSNIMIREVISVPAEVDQQEVVILKITCIKTHDLVNSAHDLV